MTDCICMVHEGQISDSQEAALRAVTNAISKAHFGASAAMNWVSVPKGSGFTDARPSTSVILSIRSDRLLAPSEHVPLLHELGRSTQGGPRRKKSQIWSEIASAVANHSGISASDVLTFTTDTPASWVMEGGDVLPESGEEKAWLARHEAKMAAERQSA